jgi:hypothetical protein
MWIRVKETYCGADGVFIAGELREISEELLEKLTDKKRRTAQRLKYEQAPAPWEAQKDQTAVRVDTLTSEITTVKWKSLSGRSPRQEGSVQYCRNSRVNR